VRMDRWADRAYEEVRRLSADRFLQNLTGLPVTADLFAGAHFHRIHDLKEALLYGLVRTLRPENVVETGVCEGWSSRAILAAMEDSGTGHLVSIDLPEVGRGQTNEDGKWDGSRVPDSASTGREVPAYLRHRWELELGSSEELLERALDRVGPVDLFFHDSAHTERLMRWEYTTAWPHLKGGGVLYSDDIDWTPAFDDFARSVGRHPWRFRLGRRGGETGGLRK